MKRAALIVFLTSTWFMSPPSLQAGWIRVTATVTTSADIPVFSFFLLRSRLNEGGDETLWRSYSLNGPMMSAGTSGLVETFVEDLPPSDYYRQYVLLVGAYGGVYEPLDAASSIPIEKPVAPHTGMITSLIAPPPVGATFESVWGADEQDVVDAYQTYVYDTPEFGAPIEDWLAYWQAIAPFTNMIFADPSRLIRWTPGPDGLFTMSGPIYQFSDPVEIGSIQGEFTSSFTPTTPVPEPGSALLTLVGGGIALLLFRRRRNPPEAAGRRQSSP